MEIIRRELPKDCTIVDTGDWHVGALNCHMKGIHKMLKRIREDENCYVILKGDLIEAIAPNDKRFAHCSTDVEMRTAQDQMAFLYESMLPIKDRILGIMLGNHEWKLINTFDIAKHLAKSLEIPYGGYSCVFHALSNGATKWKAFFTHGSGMLRSNAKDPIQRKGNQAAALKLKLERSGFADCVYMSMGHIHHSIIVSPTINDEIVLTTTPTGINQTYKSHDNQAAARIPADARWYASSPSFLRLYSDPGQYAISYAEIAGYPPTELGWLEVDVRNHEIANVRKVVV